jgi:hypothetical protein
LDVEDFDTEDFDKEGLDNEGLDRMSFAAVLARLLVAPRPAGAACLAPFEETLILRVFCDTACAWNCHAPVRGF